MIQIKSWDVFWIECSLSKRKDIFNTSTEIFMSKYGFSKNTTKKHISCCVLNDLLGSKRYDLLNEIYYDILNFKEKPKSSDIYQSSYEIVERICLWAINMEGLPIDNYWWYSTLETLYTIHKKEVENSINICKKSYEEIESYLPYLKETQNTFRKDKDYDTVGTLPNYVFCRDCLIYRLVDAYKFNEAEYYLEEMTKRNLFPDKNGQERMIYNKIYLLSRYVPFLLKNNQVEKAIVKSEEYKEINSTFSSVAFKEVADYFHKIKEYKAAYKYYSITAKLNPMMCGIDKKIIKVSEILNKSYTQDKDKIIEFLDKQQNSLSNTYELLNISKRYLELKEYEKAIKSIEKLIEIRGNENTLLLNLSKIHKTMGRDKEKKEEYDLAISHYNTCLKVLNKAINTTKTIENERELITRIIQKIN